MKNLFIFCLLAMLMVSCKKEDLIINLYFWNTFKIDAGEHDSGKHLFTFEGKKLEFLASFDNSAMYTTVNPNNQGDINKLFGFSDCNNKHHENSARFGWVWNSNKQKLEIYAYCYDGSLKYKHITDIELNRVYHYKIDIDDNKYYFHLDGHVVEMDRGCDKKWGMIRYYLYPYFGGNETAPHTIKIRIRVVT